MKRTDIVQLLLDRGVQAVGGPHALQQAIGMAIQFDRAGVLRRILKVEGTERMDLWARVLYDGSTPMLHFAASFGSAASVGVLLAAGADETQCDSRGMRASDYVGCRVPTGQLQNMTTKIAAIRRMLVGAQARRARSFAWPTSSADDGEEGAKIRTLDLHVRVFRRRAPRTKCFII